MPPLDPDHVKNGLCTREAGNNPFGTGIVEWSHAKVLKKTNLPLMGSGHADGMDIAIFTIEIIS